MKIFIRFFIFLVLLGILLNSVGAIAQNPSSSGYRVILIGIDCATWDVIIPLVKQGKMPNFEKIIREGAVGDLHSIDPMYSPVLWNTIATGKEREKHGITNFLVKSADGKKMLPVTTSQREVKAFWNIASDEGKKVAVSGWYVSWPAEKINGYIASDQTWPTRERKLGLTIGMKQMKNKPLPNRTYPDSLFKEINPFHIKSDEIPVYDMERLGNSITSVPEGLFFAEVELPEELQYAYAQDMSWHNVARYLWDTKRPDILAAYFNGIDVSSHLLWTQYRYYRMREYGETSPWFPTVIRPYSFDSERQTLLTPEDRRTYIQGRILERYYIYINEIIGDYMRRMDDKTVLMLCSDHGFGESYSSTPVILPDGSYTTPAAWHSIRGIVALYGNPIKKGYTIKKSSIVDITPTLLYLSGISPADDMDGNVIKEAINSSFLVQNPIKSIPSYEEVKSVAQELPVSQSTTSQKTTTSPKRKPRKIPVVEDEELLERLKALGYIQ